jgi:hypothetical protein
MKRLLQSAEAALSQRTGSGWAAFVLALALALTAAGCGPGLGGTGTGLEPEPEPVTAFGASEVSVCSADLGDLLGCGPLTPNGVTALPGAAAVLFADPNAPADSTLELNAQLAQLNLRCMAWQFNGRFAQVPGQAPRYYGQLQAAGSVVGLATLEVRRNGTGLAATLTDAAGRVMAGPVLMQRATAPAAGGRCG